MIGVSPNTSHASDTLTGTVTLSYKASSGKLSVTLESEQSLSSSATYTWYKDASVISTTTSSTYYPSDDGTYSVKITDTDSYSGSLTSNTITLYVVTATTDSSSSGSATYKFSNSYGLYKAGDTVSVKATVSSGYDVSNWTTDVSGVKISATDNPVKFTMPAQDVQVTATITASRTISISNGSADKYSAKEGDIVSIQADEISGKKFSSWTSSGGGSFEDSTSEITRFTMPDSNVVITANYVDSSDEDEDVNTNTIADATRVVYTVLDDAGYTVKVEHHSQGPLCDAAFKEARASNWLVLDYFNITINGSLTTYETSSPVRICLTIPDDLQQEGRIWSMICISRNGQPYTFSDEDSDDTTITFSTDRFYAFAMCYTDYTEPEEEEETDTDLFEEEEESTGLTNVSTVHNISESQTVGSQIYDSSESEFVTSTTSDGNTTYTGNTSDSFNGNTDTTADDSSYLDSQTVNDSSSQDSSITTNSQSSDVNIGSNKKSSIQKSNGSQIPTLTL